MLSKLNYHYYKSYALWISVHSLFIFIIIFIIIFSLKIML